uniref:Homeobox domain-containing protein n=1 Tax=Arcella intermedia TaxID=1963864 RepID=A0A6B2LL97_9EUKA
MKEMFDNEIQNLENIANVILENEQKFLNFSISDSEISLRFFKRLDRRVRNLVEVKFEGILQELVMKMQRNVNYLLAQDYEDVQVNPAILKEWILQHILNPYPSDIEKKKLAYMSNLLPRQVSTWFGNYRVRNKQKIESKIESICDWFIQRNLPIPSQVLLHSPSHTLQPRV